MPRSPCFTLYVTVFKGWDHCLLTYGIFVSAMLEHITALSRMPFGKGALQNMVFSINRLIILWHDLEPL